MFKLNTRWALPALAVLLIASGCTLFRSSSYRPIDQAAVTTGASVSLGEETSSGWGGRIARTIVLKVGEGGPSHRVDVTDREDEGYKLHTVQGSDRVFVVAYPSQRVLVSMDLATGQTWDGEEGQPEWAVVQ